MTQDTFSRRTLLLGAVAMAAVLPWRALAQGAGPAIDVMKDPNCGGCSAWIEIGRSRVRALMLGPLTSVDPHRPTLAHRCRRGRSQHQSLSQLPALLERLPGPDQAGTFSVATAPPEAAYCVGRNNSGYAALLMRTSGATNRVPLVVAGIQARFSVACRLEERDHEVRTENLTVVSCRSQERAAERYFLTTMEFLAATLGPNPTVP